MDKKYQDVVYIVVDAYIGTDVPFVPLRFQRVMWGERQIRIINITFGTSHIKIAYINKNNEYRCKILEKQEFCKLIIS